MPQRHTTANSAEHWRWRRFGFYRADWTSGTEWTPGAKRTSGAEWSAGIKWTLGAKRALRTDGT